MGCPVSRLRYTYVFTPNFIFNEVAECYRQAGKRLGWMTVDNDYYAWAWADTRPEWYDPDQVLVFWCNLPWKIPPRPYRKATCVFHYVESVGNLENLVDTQRHWLDIHLKKAHEVDLFLVGTPPVRDFWLPRCPKVAMMPIGYDPEVMGRPDWTREKVYDVGFCGVPVGRREWILPAMRKRFGPKFLDVTVFGRARNAAFDACKAMLYVGHSDEKAFADMRLWSATACSAALVTEDRDAWPAVAGRHYIALPHAQKENVDAFVDMVEQALKQPLTDIAKTAHEELSKFTVERCFEEFLVPAVLEVRGAGGDIRPVSS